MGCDALSRPSDTGPDAFPIPKVTYKLIKLGAIKMPWRTLTTLALRDDIVGMLQTDFCIWELSGEGCSQLRDRLRIVGIDQRGLNFRTVGSTRYDGSRIPTENRLMP